MRNRAPRRARSIAGTDLIWIRARSNVEREGSADPPR
jgi:hypothetical protein